jgi:hypothetical protein
VTCVEVAIDTVGAVRDTLSILQARGIPPRAPWHDSRAALPIRGLARACVLATPPYRNSSLRFGATEPGALPRPRARALRGRVATVRRSGASCLPQVRGFQRGIHSRGAILVVTIFSSPFRVSREPCVPAALADAWPIRQPPSWIEFCPTYPCGSTSSRSRTSCVSCPPSKRRCLRRSDASQLRPTSRAIAHARLRPSSPDRNALHELLAC